MNVDKISVIRQMTDIEDLVAHFLLATNHRRKNAKKWQDFLQISRRRALAKLILNSERTALAAVRDQLKCRVTSACDAI